MTESAPKEESELELLSIRLASAEKTLATIEERNKRVEGDKAWEGSMTRVVAICTLTYLVAACVLYVLHSERVLLDALLPPIGFYLSTQSLPALKKWWLDQRKK